MNLPFQKVFSAKVPLRLFFTVFREQRSPCKTGRKGCDTDQHNEGDRSTHIRLDQQGKEEIRGLCQGARDGHAPEPF